jgi:cell division transport system ATP-binding protein
MIVFNNVVKKFGVKKVLDGINLLISGGEFVIVTGPSGAGKSTLVNLLIGAEKISSGEINVDKYLVHEMNEKKLQAFRRKIGVVFQDYKLLPQKDVFENVAFALEVCSFPDNQIKERVEKLLKTVGLYEQRFHFPSELSGGEAQRCAIARALVHDPELVLADEPTGNLDPENTSEIIGLLTKINEMGKTVILTTHNKPLVDSLHQRVIRIKDGKIDLDIQARKKELQ